MWVDGDPVLLATRYTPGVGAFGIPGEIVENGRVRCKKWYTCRDRFRSVKKADVIWFRFDATVTNGRNISMFIDLVEERLGLKTAMRTRMGATSRLDVIWIRWSSWWQKYSMRRSLFTALVRCATAYRPENDNFETALYSQPYTMKTRDAVRRFLAGHTIYTGSAMRGWQDAFQNVPIENLKGYLRKPVKPATP